MLSEIKIKEIIKNIPEAPGVYRYYNQTKDVLYVGKANNLKNRVSSYFQNSRLDKLSRLQLMVSQISYIEYTVVANESEALILEANLIYSLQPKYNILLKDDKSYVYVRITKREIPTITLTRYKYDKNSIYFGPFTRKYEIGNVLRVIRSIFPYCDKKVQDGKPCSYVQIKLCEGVCCGRESKESYQQKIEQIKSILNGDISKVKQWLKNKIELAVSFGNFELAALWRDRIIALESILSNQKIILPVPQNLDIVTIIRETDSSGSSLGSIFVQHIREGKMVNVNNFLLSGAIEGEGSVFDYCKSFLVGYYAEKSDDCEILLQTYSTDRKLETV